RTESAAVLKHWFGVGTRAVWNWRRAFGVAKYGTSGSDAAHRAASERGAAAMRGKEWTDEERDARAELARRLGLRLPDRWAAGGWSAEQLALLGTDHDEVIAKRVGRSANAVTVKRVRLKVPAFRDRRCRGNRR